MKRIDFIFCKASFAALWHRLGKAPLERHERAPADCGLAASNAFVTQPARLIERLGRTDQDLFRVASAQGAGTAERQMVDYGNAPARSAATIGGSRRRRAGANDNEIVLRAHWPARHLQE